MFIINARLYTFDRKNTVIENGYIHLQQGKILSLGGVNILLIFIVIASLKRSRLPLL